MKTDQGTQLNTGTFVFKVEQSIIFPGVPEVKKCSSYWVVTHLYTETTLISILFPYSVRISCFKNEKFC